MKSLRGLFIVQENDKIASTITALVTADVLCYTYAGFGKQPLGKYSDCLN